MSEITRDRLTTAEDGVRHEGRALTPAAPPASIGHLRQLFTKVDATFARARARHRDRMLCREGCTDCCDRDTSVTGVEAALIRSAVSALPQGAQAALAERAAGRKGLCPALDDAGKCSIHAVRPLACRTVGMPLRLGPQPGVRSLPVVEACAKNFVAYDLEGVDAASVLDQRTLANVLSSLDAAYADETGSPRGEAIPMSAVLAG